MHGLVQAVQLPEEYLYNHHTLVDEFRNASAWPKHLLVRERQPQQAARVQEGQGLRFSGLWELVRGGRHWVRF